MLEFSFFLYISRKSQNFTILQFLQNAFFNSERSYRRGSDSRDRSGSYGSNDRSSDRGHDRGYSQTNYSDRSGPPKSYQNDAPPQYGRYDHREKVKFYNGVCYAQ